MARHPFLKADSTTSSQPIVLKSIRLCDFRQDEVDLFEGYLNSLLTKNAPDIVAWLDDNDAGHTTIFYSRSMKNRWIELDLMIAFHSENDALAFRLVFI